MIGDDERGRVAPDMEERMQRWGSGRLIAAASVALLTLASWDTAKAQEFAGREKLRAHGQQAGRTYI